MHWRLLLKSTCSKLSHLLCMYAKISPFPEMLRESERHWRATGKLFCHSGWGHWPVWIRPQNPGQDLQDGIYREQSTRCFCGCLSARLACCYRRCAIGVCNRLLGARPLKDAYREGSLSSYPSPWMLAISPISEATGFSYYSAKLFEAYTWI